LPIDNQTGLHQGLTDLLANDSSGMDQAKGHDPNGWSFPRTKPVLCAIQKDLDLSAIKPTEHEDATEIQEPHQAPENDCCHESNRA